MAATVTAPLSVPLRYDPVYKVEIRLHEPLLSHGVTQSEIRVELITLCEQFEVVCLHEMTEASHIGKGSTVFHNKATVLVNKMKQLLYKMPQLNQLLESYFQVCGLDLLYPRVISYIKGDNSFSLSASTGAMEGYFAHVSSLQQVFSLASQINTDLRTKDNHKYIAHQLALLYQSLNNHTSDSPQVTLYKKAIEDNFKILKSSMIVEKDLNKSVLNSEMKKWFLDVTSGLIQVISSFPAELTQPMAKPASMLSTI